VLRTDRTADNNGISVLLWWFSRQTHTFVLGRLHCKDSKVTSSILKAPAKGSPCFAMAIVVISTTDQYRTGFPVVSAFSTAPKGPGGKESRSHKLPSLNLSKEALLEVLCILWLVALAGRSVVHVTTNLKIPGKKGARMLSVGR